MVMAQTHNGNHPGWEVRNYARYDRPAAVGIMQPMSDLKLAPHVTPLVREIYRRMTELGLNATALAAKTGRNESYFRDLFRGKSRAPNAEYLPAIAEALDCEMVDLLNPGEPGGQPVAGSEINEPEEVALIGLWRRLSLAGKGRMMRAILREAERAMRGMPEGGPD